MSQPYIEIISPSGRQRYPVGTEPITIGRSSENMIQTDDDLASRRHCVVQRTKDGYQLKDLDSRNGTTLNGEKVTTVTLLSGDEFRIGKVRFVFEEGGSPRPERERGTKRARAASNGDRDDSSDPAGRSPKAEREERRASDGNGEREDKRSASSGGPDRRHAPMPKAREKAEKKRGFGNLLGRGKSRKADGAGKAPSKESAEDNVGLDAYSVGTDEDEAYDPGPSTAHRVADASADPEDVLNEVCEAGPYKGFAEHEIALVNARGQTIHEAQIEVDEDDDDLSDLERSVHLLRLVLLAGFRTRASDIHFEPKNQNMLVRLRVDGSMVEAVRLDQVSGRRMFGAIKVLADVDIAQRNIVQEGHFSTVVPDRTVDYRVSFTPSMYGQKLVIRRLDPANAPQFLDDLQLPGWMLQNIRKTSKQSSGMVLVCGPTGSGKTTTLYSVLRDIDTYDRNVITIEDPVEYQIDGVTQIPADEARGNSFHALLRSVLRQDPDVILLGEIRDEETAKTAMQAAMTGHLVLSTVHAKDTIGTIFRLLDLGVEPYLVASSLNLILAQRLVRQLCPNCKAGKKPTPRETMRMGRRGKGVQQIFYPVGCPRCLNVGYQGRRGLYELLVVNDGMRDVILNNPTMSAIREALKRTVFTTLEDLAWEYVATGITSVEEVERIASG